MGIVKAGPFEPMVGDFDDHRSNTAQGAQEMIERNPAPGTEDLPPMTAVYDFATGDFEVLGPTQL